MLRRNLLLYMVPCIVWGCQVEEDIKPQETASRSFQTKNVVVVVIDGPRFSETWGDNSKKYVPNLAVKLAPQGVIYNQFFNNGLTRTGAGHTAITTGSYQLILNNGREFPQNPSLFQLWLNKTRSNPDQAYIVTSKSKLDLLADCSDIHWRGKFNPRFQAKNREDSETFQEALNILRQQQPQLMLLHFRGPDEHAHNNNWPGYINGIIETDQYVNDLWDFLQADDLYRNTTALFVTNDHGRHLNDVKNGFVEHGDNCMGCRHINLFAAGPDFKSDVQINEPRNLIDLAPTIAYILDLEMPQATGNVLTELFNN